MLDEDKVLAELDEVLGPLMDHFTHPSLDENELTHWKAKYADLAWTLEQTRAQLARARKRLGRIKERARRKRLLKGWDKTYWGDNVFELLRRDRRRTQQRNWDQQTEDSWWAWYGQRVETDTLHPTRADFLQHLRDEHKKAIKYWLLSNVPRFPCA